MNNCQLWLQARKTLRFEMVQSNQLLSLNCALAHIKLAKVFIARFPDTLGDPCMQGRGLPICTLKNAINEIFLVWEHLTVEQKTECLNVDEIKQALQLIHQNNVTSDRG